MLDPQSVTVTIYGQEYTLKGEAEPEYVEKVAEFVDRKMREIAGKFDHGVDHEDRDPRGHQRC